MSKTFHNKTTVVAARPRSKHLRETGGYYTAIAANKNASSAAQTAIKDGMNRYFEEILDSNSAIAGIKALYDHFIIQSPANEDQNQPEVIKNISEILRHLSLQTINPGSADEVTLLVSDISFSSLGFISQYGLSIGSAGGGLITAVHPATDLGSITSESLTETFSAYAIQQIYELAIQGGGNPINLNGASVTGTAYFYAPYDGGDSGQVLIAGGDDVAPSWVNASSLSVGYATSAGYAANAGSATKATQDGSGNIISSTYLTSGDITGKADKVISATNGHFAALDANGNLVDSGHKHSDYLTSQDILGKADKVVSAINGNFAALDASGNLVDSGYKPSDFLTSHQDISGKADKVLSATNGHFAALDANGNLVDSGHKHSDYLTAASLADYVTLTTNQTITGEKTFTDGNLVIRATIDSSSPDYWMAYYTRIYNRWWGDGTWHGGSWGNTAIRNSICFPYGQGNDLGDTRTNICVGHIRGGGNNSYGFGIGYEVADSVNGNYLQPMMMLRKNGDLYVNGEIRPNWGASTVLTTLNFNYWAHPVHGSLDSYMWCSNLMADSYLWVGRNHNNAATCDRSIYFGSDNSNYIRFTTANEFAFTKSIVPVSNENLGSSSARWSSVYGVAGDFSGNISVAGSASIIGDLRLTTNKRIYFGSDNTNYLEVVPINNTLCLHTNLPIVSEDFISQYGLQLEEHEEGEE